MIVHGTSIAASMRIQFKCNILNYIAYNERENMCTNKPKWSHKEMQHIAKIKNKKTNTIDINITQINRG